jgi:hypothetical protein
MNAAESEWDIGIEENKTAKETRSRPGRPTMRGGLGQKGVASVK